MNSCCKCLPAQRVSGRWPWEDTAFPRSRVEAADGEDIESLPMPAPEPWPALDPQALYGLAGDIVRTFEPQTEADPVAILGQLLVAYGNAVGHTPYFQVEGDKHFLNLFLLTIGKSSKGRKGTGWGRAKQMMVFSDNDWTNKCIRSGLVSGEGLIYFVRDPVEQENEDGEMVVTPGVSDKRMLVVETEFGQVLRILKREGNTLSGFIRQAWDTGDLSTMAKNSPTRATGAHISVIGHVTTPELQKYLDQTELFNGFANRFLWLLVRRSKLLPEGGRPLDLSALGNRLRYALTEARKVGAMRRNDKARSLWCEVYPDLTGERSGLCGAVTGRAEAQVLRLSMLYALLDGSSEIDEPHLRAALAFWRYADLSAQLIFGAEAEDPLVARVLEKIRAAPDGLTRSELRDAFHRNVLAKDLLAALAKLRDRGEITDEKDESTGGRPAQRWRLRDNANTRKVPSAGTTGEANPDLATSSSDSSREEVVRV
jgi:hypothetical protein